MGRMIEIDPAQALPTSLTLRVGDLLVFAASGGHVRSGAGVIEMLGPFIPGVVGGDGGILSPMGSPNAVLFSVRSPGRATIDVMTGDPWRSPRANVIDIIVTP
jgi:hypothetical protein